MSSLLRAFNDPKLPDNFFRVQVTILRSLGIELLKEESLRYKIYSRTVLFIIVYSFTFGEALELYSQWGDLNAVVNVCNYLFTHITGAIKTTLLFVNRKRIGNIMKMMHDVPFRPDENRGGKQEEIYVRTVIKTTEIQLVVYFAVVSVTLNSGIIVFLTSRLFRAKNDWQYPYVPITIIDTSDSPLFEIACVYQIICVTLYAAIIATIYVLLTTIMAHLSVQLKILQDAFRNIRTKAQSLQEIENHRLPQGFYTKLLLGSYIEHHLKVLDLTRQMEELCNLMIFVVLMASVLIMCFLLYQSSRCKIGSIAFIQNAFYYLIIVCQVGMYCYWGDQVTVEASNVAQAAAEANWVGAPISVGKGLVLVIARSQRPLKITAAKFVPLSIETFMKIIKGSFSYFMVLRQAQEMEG